MLDSKQGWLAAGCVNLQSHMNECRCGDLAASSSLQGQAASSINDQEQEDLMLQTFVPLVLTPVTVLTSAEEVATSERPGSRMSVRPVDFTRSRTVSIRSFGVGSTSPLQGNTQPVGTVRLCARPQLLHGAWLHLCTVVTEVSEH